MTQLILNIVLTGMQLWTTERRISFQRKHSDILEELMNAQGKIFPDYTDAAVSVAKKKYDNFLEAYHVEMQEAVKEKERANA